MISSNFFFALLQCFIGCIVKKFIGCILKFHYGCTKKIIFKKTIFFIYSTLNILTICCFFFKNFSLFSCLKKIFKLINYELTNLFF